MKTLTKLTILSFSVLLAACTNSSMLAPTTAKSNTKVAESETSKKIAQLETQAKTLKHFQYIHNNENYDVYLSTQPEFIQLSTAKGIKKFFYKNGKLIANQEHNQIKFFNAEHKPDQALLKESQLLLNLFSYNKADKGIDRINTGDEAKVNYLCISKIQQVAQTKRVFRSPENAIVKANLLKGIVRLNGNQYYHLECNISDNQVSKLSLISK